MSDQATLKRHADLFDRTATRLGIDLQEAAISGELRFDEISESVLRCVNCPNPSDCGHWLERDETGPQSAPVYCQNKALLSRLQGAEG